MQNTPWMSRHEIDLLNSYISIKGKNSNMLEYGSGGSTLYFSQLVGTYTSVEHDSSWFDKVSPQVSENTTVLLRNKDTDEYYNFLCKDKNYDYVLIDGRNRVKTAEVMLDYISCNSYVFLHDYFTRPQYHAVRKWYKEIAGVFDGQSVVILQKK